MEPDFVAILRADIAALRAEVNGIRQDIGGDQGGFAGGLAHALSDAGRSSDIHDLCQDG